MVTTDRFVLFWGTIFSNFANTPYTSHDGIKFFCTEQEFMYRKAMLFEDEEIANKILKSKDPKQIKKLGRQVKNYDDVVWDAVRYDAMYAACRSKFTQNKEAKKALLSYPGKTFVEASPFDTIWGIGLSECDYRASNPALWKGKNLLGQILTRLRNEIECLGANGIIEMTVEPSPQWIKDAGEEIAERYHLSVLEKVIVGGVISKHYRLQSEKSRSNISEVSTDS